MTETQRVRGIPRGRGQGGGEQVQGQGRAGSPCADHWMWAVKWGGDPHAPSIVLREEQQGWGTAGSPQGLGPGEAETPWVWDGSTWAFVGTGGTEARDWARPCRSWCGPGRGGQPDPGPR